MVQEFDGWQTLGKPLGKGGQGTVYLARSPQANLRLKENALAIKEAIREFAAEIQKSTDELPQKVEELSQKIVQVGAPPSDGLGALKIFDIPQGDKDEEARVLNRLRSETETLEKTKHPAVLRLLHANVESRLMVTEFHKQGSLKNNLGLYKGKSLQALYAFRTLVEGVCQIHNANLVHRDIKAENIFVAASGALVLGDFGIVFHGENGRLTATFERASSHYWMAPWAFKNQRLALEEINPKLDTYPLGKVLWSLIAGRDGFLNEEFDAGENNLEKLFPHDRSMARVNKLLRRCVVREAKDCELENALLLRNAVNDTIREIENNPGQRDQGANTWPCRMCGRGYYHVVGSRAAVIQVGIERRILRMFECDHCQHTQLFGWREMMK